MEGTATQGGAPEARVEMAFLKWVAAQFATATIVYIGKAFENKRIKFANSMSGLVQYAG